MFPQICVASDKLKRPFHGKHNNFIKCKINILPDFSLTLGRDVPSGQADKDRIRRRPEAAAHRRRRGEGL
jgi:hypothetical protein